jgi:GT2 family glycosyltransferase
MCTCTRLGVSTSNAAPPAAAYLGIGADPFLYLPGGNMSFKRSVLIEIGGFNENLTYGYDDVEVCCRIIDAGYHIQIAEDALVYHRLSANSHRDEQGISRDAYSFLRARAIFAVQNGLGRQTPNAVFTALIDHANDWRRQAHWYFKKGVYTNSEYTTYVERIDQALHDGILAGVKERLSRQFLDPLPSQFRPFTNR